MIAILYPLKMDKNLSEAYSSIYKEGTKYGLTKGTGKPGGAMKDYLDKKAKKLQREYDNQSKEKKNNPAFQSSKLNPQPQYNSRYRKEWEALKLMEQEEYAQDFNEWKSGLVEEGYDISRWSESELVETFINEHDLWKSKDAIMKAISESDKKGSGSGLGDGVFDHESLSMTPEEVGAVTAETHYGRTCKIHPKKGDRYAIYEADGSLSPGARDEKEDVFKFKHFPSQQHALAKCNKAIKSDKLCKHRDGSTDRPWKTSTAQIPSDYLDKSEKKFVSGLWVGDTLTPNKIASAKSILGEICIAASEPDFLILVNCFPFITLTSKSLSRLFSPTTWPL